MYSAVYLKPFYSTFVWSWSLLLYLSLQGILQRAINWHFRCKEPLKKKNRAPNKCPLFVWLALLGRCWTFDRLRSHGLRQEGACALCAQEPGIIDHLLAGWCVFSRESWFQVLSRVGLQYLTQVVLPLKKIKKLKLLTQTFFPFLGGLTLIRESQKCFEVVLILGSFGRQESLEGAEQSSLRGSVCF
jgi:hypothetical protein